ncbi:MAG: Hsp70 family protein, partial [Myxococcales bacterium]|nr:Hsp70 family protein [Myxococcales bacterium]
MTVVGIDLGTTHCAVARVTADEGARPALTPIAQLTSATSVEKLTLLPSFLYFAAEGEPDLALPWDSERRYAAGEHARARGVEAPLRVVASAKSWLCHAGVDRRSGLLPQHAPSDIEAISPVEASYRLLD